LHEGHVYRSGVWQRTQNSMAFRFSCPHLPHFISPL
jgi:hypothetical protein